MKQIHFFAAVVTAGMMCLSTFSVQGYAGTDNSKDVVETVIGDIDQNGVVDPADAIAILKINANENAYSENQIKAADVNADGAITAEDATMVLTFYAKTMAGMNPVWNSNAIFIIIRMELPRKVSMKLTGRSIISVMKRVSCRRKAQMDIS